MLNFQSSEENDNKFTISANADGGPRSRVCARETLRLAPHRRERKFSGAHVCRVTLKHLPKRIVASFRSLWGTS